MDIQLSLLIALPLSTFRLSSSISHQRFRSGPIPPRERIKCLSLALLIAHFAAVIFNPNPTPNPNPGLDPAAAFPASLPNEEAATSLVARANGSTAALTGVELLIGVGA